MMTRFTAIACACLLLSCRSSGSGSPPEPVVETLPPVDTQQFVVLTERSLDADGDGTGLDAYDLIRDFGGPNPIEAPDLYPENHPGIAHIYEDSDSVLGNHFVFIIHRDIDIDRDKTDVIDRQRNEIKAYEGSEEALKGFENETFIYKWKFQLDPLMEVSTRFSHFFQLKAVGGQDGQPIVTISGVERGGADGIEVRHFPVDQADVLARKSWSLVTGEWLEVYCRVTFSQSGGLRMIVKRVRDGEIIFNIDEPALDLWRGDDPAHFVRPKWGIYRSLLDKENLRAAEEAVRFANFTVSEVMPVP